jgi:hypothetical protein
MLIDMQLRALKPAKKIYKVADQRGLYAAVTPSGAVSFRYDYRVNGRRETLVIGRYDPSLSARKPRADHPARQGLTRHRDATVLKLEKSRSQRCRLSRDVLFIRRLVISLGSLRVCPHVSRREPNSKRAVARGSKRI